MSRRVWNLCERGIIFFKALFLLLRVSSAFTVIDNRAEFISIVACGVNSPSHHLFKFQVVSYISQWSLCREGFLRGASRPEAPPSGEGQRLSASVQSFSTHHAIVSSSYEEDNISNCLQSFLHMETFSLGFFVINIAMRNNHVRLTVLGEHTRGSRFKLPTILGYNLFHFFLYFWLSVCNFVLKHLPSIILGWCSYYVILTILWTF